ncbi:homoserine O-acetyltransferase [Humitalea rosea]|uniref:Homoserine O-acetyltransferase n=1 Tax=Humitalea rosea TaxID=990373 RepID=A0A2W7IE42_9PROT|nr:alpha/beta fold hydrolase [Humitalea rosea]PZW45015.1 homoserine O-acetyltransferase [Humitalea rosea]
MDDMDWPRATGSLDLGDLPLRGGGVLRDARLAWRSHGRLNAARDNVVLYPTSYSAHGADLEWLIGPEGVLDPGRWFIVIPEMFGNGVSSSPSNAEGYPALVTAWDNVAAQVLLLREVWGITRLHAVYGWSMGAQQAYHWAAAYPEAVARAVVVCGSARTAVHNRIFLKSLMAVLEAAPEYDGAGGFSTPPRLALRAFGRIYATMALSQDFYRAGLHGGGDLDTYLHDGWEARYHQRHAADLLAQLRCWEAGDIAPGGDLPAALAAITARVLLMPGETDLYFRVADNAAELAHLRAGRLVPIPSIWGHRAGNPATTPPDAAFLRAMVRDFLL